ncbi:MAG: sigma-54 dependent transcriptional regulator [Thermodesulfovibrionales bacterium]
MKIKGKIFLVDDDELIVAMLTRVLKQTGYDVRAVTSADDIVSHIEAWAPDILMLDINLPGKSGIEILREIGTRQLNSVAIMLTADDSAETAVKAMKLGAADYLTKPFDIEEVKIVIANALERSHMKQELEYHRQVSSSLFTKELIGNSPAIRELKSKIDKMAHAGISTILITGESGTGKELMARYIHNALNGGPDTKYAPFIGVNCAALPETLLESELFGYEKGAFTDAKSDKKGVFELAEEGTLLLDEIGEMKSGLQSKLLRVLEERSFRRIGGKEEVPIDVTVMATTNRNLAESLSKGEFRLDLYYRLNAFSLVIPPLRERKEDIPLLGKHYLSYFSAKYNRHAIKDFSPEAVLCMISYPWPGNIRELKNVIERIVVLENISTITPQHLPQEISYQIPAAPTESAFRIVLPEAGISLDDVERDLLQQALEKADHNKTVAAKLLNISYDSLRYQARKFGLD